MCQSGELKFQYLVFGQPVVSEHLTIFRDNAEKIGDAMKNEFDFTPIIQNYIMYVSFVHKIGNFNIIKI